jgi:hypothetical protein
MKKTKYKKADCRRIEIREMIEHELQEGGKLMVLMDMMREGETGKMESWILEKHGYRLGEVAEEEESDRNVTEESALIENSDKMKTMDVDDVSEAEHELTMDNYSNTLKKAFG